MHFILDSMKFHHYISSSIFLFCLFTLFSWQDFSDLRIHIFPQFLKKFQIPFLQIFSYSVISALVFLLIFWNFSIYPLFSSMDLSYSPPPSLPMLYFDESFYSIFLRTTFVFLCLAYSSFYLRSYFTFNNLFFFISIIYTCSLFMFLCSDFYILISRMLFTSISLWEIWIYFKCRMLSCILAFVNLSKVWIFRHGKDFFGVIYNFQLWVYLPKDLIFINASSSSSVVSWLPHSAPSVVWVNEAIS